MSKANVFLTLLACFAAPSEAFSNSSNCASHFHQFQLSDGLAPHPNYIFNIVGSDAQYYRLKFAGYKLKKFKGKSVSDHGFIITSAPEGQLNRIIQNISRKGYKVVFDEKLLSNTGNAAGYDFNARIVYIDRESLRTGQPSTNLFHELRHLGLARKTSHHISAKNMVISLVIDSPKVSSGFSYYKDAMSFQEMSTFLQDMRWHLSNSTRATQNAPATRGAFERYLARVKFNAEVIEAGLHRYQEIFAQVRAALPKENQKIEIIREVAKNGFELRYQSGNLKVGYTRWGKDFPQFWLELENGNTLFFIVQDLQNPETALRGLEKDFRRLEKLISPKLISLIDAWSDLKKRIDTLEPDQLPLEAANLHRDMAPVRREISAIMEADQTRILDSRGAAEGEGN